MNTTPIDSTLAAVSARLRDGAIRSVDLIEECLSRIEQDRQDRQDKGVHAVVEYDTEAARRQARAADRLLRTSPASAPPLCGIPVTVKRTYEVEGFAHQQEDVDDGAPYGRPAPRDATAVARLREAGAVILGRTNAPPRAADIDTVHTAHGRTRHPHDPRLSPGGSSGGSAAAVAARHTALDLGSDVAGSARIPAHLCGVYALRPTYGTLSMRGHIPGPRTDLDPAEMLTPAPLARHAADLSLLWRALWRPAPSPPRAGAPRPIAAVLTDGSAPMADGVASALHEARGRLRGAGHVVDDVALPVDLADNWLLCQQLLYAEDAGQPPAEPLPRPVAGTHPVEIALWSAGVSHREWLGLHRARVRTHLAWERFFAGYRALILPVLGVPTLPQRDPRLPLLVEEIAVGTTSVPLFSLSTWCALASVAGLPAVTLPIPRAGAPAIGLQVIARHGGDGDLLALVEEITELLNVEPPKGRGR